MRVIFSGGGTGGHIYPAVSIAKEMQKRHIDIDILFIGTDKGMEKDIVPKEGYVLKYIKVQGFARKITFKNVKALSEAITSIFSAAKILKDFRPDIVIGTGGYVCGPVVLAASLMGIPTLIHEQNAFPGVTNKILSKLADNIVITFEEARNYFKASRKVYFTGNPLRHGFFAVSKADGLKHFGFSKDLPLILIVGGSRGAKKVNQCVIKLVKECQAHKKNQILHITGQSQYESCMDLYKLNGVSMESNLIKVLPYLHNMPDALAACDLVISRCGAGVISEITALGKPSILIPFPFATDNHQEYNGRALEKAGAAIVILENELTDDILYEQLKNLLSDSRRLDMMSINSKKLGKPKASSDIADLIDRLVINGKKQ